MTHLHYVTDPSAVIGGADGPSYIFVAGKTGGAVCIAAAAIVLIVCVVIFVRRKKKQQK